MPTTKYVLLVVREDNTQHEISAWGVDGNDAVNVLKSVIASAGGDAGMVLITVIDEDY